MWLHFILSQNNQEQEKTDSKHAKQFKDRKIADQKQIRQIKKKR